MPTDVVYTPPEPGIITEYIGGALGAARRTEVMTQLAAVNQWLNVRKLAGDPYPEDFAALVKAYQREGGQLRQPPAHYKYFYWPEHGVVKMVREDDPRFSDPNHIHTASPE